MTDRYYMTLWPIAGDLPTRLKKVKDAGFDGFEDWVQSHATLRPLMDEHGLRYRAMVAGDTTDAFKKGLDEAFDCACDGVTVHAGRASMEFGEARDHLGVLSAIAKEYPFLVDFETHRGRCLFEPMMTARLLAELPDLWLTLDISHWTVVTESLLGGFAPQLEATLKRTRHIHARVGFEEGPQVPDPRSERWSRYLATFDGWWDTVRAECAARGEEFFTVDPEFGPPHYQWTHPATGEALADPFEVAVWMRDRLQKRWQPG
ncbi:MAG: sugar phosphate isomerase/epimerase [Fimbriimonadaceae bacterium]|nr:sugar phosphate isomerase/epimerase [Fimbriimonadaceae bacterium]